MTDGKLSANDQQKFPSDSCLISVDENWISLPQGFPNDDHLFITSGPNGSYLLLMREEQWLPLRDQIMDSKWPTRDVGDDVRGALKRILIGNAIEIEVNDLGQIPLPEDLAERIGQPVQLLWVPTSQYIELWNPDQFDVEKRVKMSWHN